jgi:hypothetical protein
VQQDVLQQVLAWLLQLPAGPVQQLAMALLARSDGWLQQLLKCWAAEVQQTRCNVQQAAAAAAELCAEEFLLEALQLLFSWAGVSAVQRRRQQQQQQQVAAAGVLAATWLGCASCCCSCWGPAAASLCPAALSRQPQVLISPTTAGLL